MTTQPTWSRLDEATADLLTLVADPEHPVGRDAVDAFLAACRRDARANGGMVSSQRVRSLLTGAQIPARRYSALWAAYTGPGKPMRRTDVWELNTDKAGRNAGRPSILRTWVGGDDGA
jgi:hypothetical protein